MEIFKLVGSIMVDSGEAQKSISKTGDEAKSLGEKLGDGVKTAAKWGAGIVSAAVAVGGAMVAAAKDTAANMDVIDKGSIRMGISAKSYQELAYAAGLCGVEMSTMEQAAKKLEGTDLNMDQAIEQIMAAGDETARTEKAIELFGEGIAYKMAPLIKAGASEMAAMRQEANDLGLVMSDDAVSSGAAMGDMFSKVEQSIAALKNSLVSELMPYGMEILQWVIDNMPVIQQTISSVIDALFPIIQPILDLVMEALPVFLDLFTSVMNALLPILQPIIESIKSIFQAMYSLINGDTQGFVESFKQVFISLGQALFGIGQLIMNNFWDGLVSIWNNLVAWVNNAIDNLVGALRDVGNTVGGFFGSGNSHAAGLTTVPFDNYPATLHRGETILNADNTADLVSLLKDLKNGAGSVGTGEPINITVQAVLDGRIIGEFVTKYIRQRGNAYGL